MQQFAHRGLGARFHRDLHTGTANLTNDSPTYF
jgi:hypothetical protein